MVENLENLVSYGVDFSIGFGLGILFDGVIQEPETVGKNLVDTAIYAGVLGLYFKYKHKVFGGGKLEPMGGKEVIQHTAAASSGYLIGQTIAAVLHMG